MIGGIGFTNWRREWQVGLTLSSTASTWSSSTPTRIVALPCFRNPAEDCSRVARNSFSMSASTRFPASSLCTIAVTSFTRRLCPRDVGVHHPDVGLPVRAEVGVAVDLDGAQALGEDVVAALREGHPRPALPVRDGARDAQGSRQRCGDPGTQALVHPHPWIQELAVVA